MLLEWLLGRETRVTPCQTQPFPNVLLRTGINEQLSEHLAGRKRCLITLKSISRNKNRKIPWNITQKEENIPQFHYMLICLIISENEVQIFYPMHSLHRKQSKATLNTKKSLFLSLFWISLLKYVFRKHACSQDQAVYQVVLIVNVISKKKLFSFCFSFST